LAEAVHEILSDFYVTLKTSANMRGHVFITGVTRFAKASIFSALNNLKDLTFNPAFAAVCGLTRAELKALFDERQKSLLKTLKADGCLPHKAAEKDLKKLIFDWYDGYSWNGTTKVLNPWSLLSFFDEKRIKGFWYQTGAPSFLEKLLKERQQSFDLSQPIPPVTEASTAISDVANLDPAALMFQTGYLTVKRVDKTGEWQYHLGLPNLEVKAAFAPLLLSIKPPKNPVLAKELSVKAKNSLLKLDAQGFETAFSRFLNHYPYELHLPSEKFYHTLLTSAMMMADQHVQNQGQTGEGRFDMLLRAPDKDLVIELKYVKFDEPAPDVVAAGKTSAKNDDEKPETALCRERAKQARTAMRQIEEKYQDAFLGADRPVYKVALVVAGRTKVLAEFEKA
jgi:hypothetical protein